RELLRDPQVGLRRAGVIAGGPELVAGVADGLDDEPIEPGLLGRRGERTGALELASPLLDVAEVLGPGERRQDPVAGGAGVGVVGVAGDDDAEALDRLVVLAAVIRQLTVLEDDA